MTVLNNFTSSYGADAVAAMGISQKINMIPMYIALGLSQGIMPLVSYNYGGRNALRMRQVILFAVQLSMAFMAAAVAVYFFGAGRLITLFMRNETIVFYGSRFLRCMCLALPFLCLDFLAVGVFQACGMGRRALIFAILRKIILEIPALFLLNWIWPMYGLACAQFAAEVVLAIAAAVTLKRLLREAERNLAA